MTAASPPSTSIFTRSTYGTSASATSRRSHCDAELLEPLGTIFPADEAGQAAQHLLIARNLEEPFLVVAMSGLGDQVGRGRPGRFISMLRRRNEMSSGLHS